MIDNDDCLTAWNEWKVICSIAGCSEHNKQVLTKEVATAFRKKINALTNTKEKTEKVHIVQDDVNKENLIFAHEFDIGLETKSKNPGVNKRTGKAKEKKHYKDIAWTAMENSNDPPLKVIRGMLLGGAGNFASPLNAIVSEFLETNFNYRFDGISITYDPGFLRAYSAETASAQMVDGSSPLELMDSYALTALKQPVQNIYVIFLKRSSQPIGGIQDNFTSCFLVFYLCIPFLNILLQQISQEMHKRRGSGRCCRDARREPSALSVVCCPLESLAQALPKGTPKDPKGLQRTLKDSK